MALSHSPATVMNGLVLCLDAGNRKSYPGSGTTWTDLSPYSNNGTLTNGPTFSSSNGGSIVFDGVDDYCLSTQNVVFGASDPFTISAWFNAYTTTNDTNGAGFGGYRRIINFTNDQGIAVNTNLVGWFAGGGLRSSAGISTNVWYKVDIANNGSRFTTYLNGTQQNTEIYAKTAINSQAWIGRWYNGVSRRFNGNIASVQIYNRELTATEITQNYNALKGRYGI